MDSSKPDRPAIFVGSSVEGLKVAYAVQSNLDHFADVTVWPQGVFVLNDIPIHRLYETAKTSDYAVFVFAPDDEVSLRGERLHSVRDNVLFEFGLFAGVNGLDHTFFLIPHEPDLHIPTDLVGVEPGRYRTDRKDKNLKAAVGHFCSDLKEIIEKQLPEELPFKYPKEIRGRFDQLLVAAMEAYRRTILASKVLSYQILTDELGELDIFDLEKLFNKTEFVKDQQLHNFSLALNLTCGDYNKRGEPAKKWKIDEFLELERRVNEKLKRMQNVIGQEA